MNSSNAHNAENNVDSNLAEALEQSVDAALTMDISETELITRLLERLHHKSRDTSSPAKKKMYDGMAGP
jgi:hypothetical protein